MDEIEINLGFNADKEIVSRLKRTLKDNNAIFIKNNWGVAGSTELRIWEFILNHQKLL